MKLKSYLKNKKLTDDAFGKLVGLSQSQISRIKTGASKPSWEALVAIEKATKGKVTAKDFVAEVSAEIEAREGAA